MDRPVRNSVVLLAVLSLALLLGACQPPPAVPGETADQDQPALSGDGRLLAMVVDQAGRPTVRLVERASGRSLPLGPLNRGQPHRSPSLSWNGRYLALIRQRGERSEVVLLDRALGRLLPLPLPADRLPEQLSLAPDARRLAVESLRDGRSSIDLLELSGLEPDLPAGVPLR